MLAAGNLSAANFPYLSKLFPNKKAATEIASVAACWLGYPDSNQERQDQNLQCYHYTISQSLCSAKV